MSDVIKFLTELIKEKGMPLKLILLGVVLSCGILYFALDPTKDMHQWVIIFGICSFVSLILIIFFDFYNYMKITFKNKKLNSSMKIELNSKMKKEIDAINSLSRQELFILFDWMKDNKDFSRMKNKYNLLFDKFYNLNIISEKEIILVDERAYIYSVNDWAKELIEKRVSLIKKKDG